MRPRVRCSELELSVLEHSGLHEVIVGCPAFLSLNECSRQRLGGRVCLHCSPTFVLQIEGRVPGSGATAEAPLMASGDPPPVLL